MMTGGLVMLDRWCRADRSWSRANDPKPIRRVKQQTRLLENRHGLLLGSSLARQISFGFVTHTTQVVLEDSE